MEDKFCNYILALILIFLQQKIFQTMLTFQELMLVSHLILPWRQAFQPHFSNLDYTIQVRLDYTIQLRLDYTIQVRLDYTIQLRLDYTIQLRLDQTRLHYIGQTRLDQTTLYSLDQTTLYRLEQIRLDYTIQLRLDYTIQVRLDQTRLHYIGQVRLHYHSFQQSMLTFQELMLVSHLILPPVSLILAIYAHILDKGTRNKMEDKFCNYILALILIFLQQKIFQTMLTFQELMLVSHLILPWRQEFQPHFSNLDYTIQLRLDYTIQVRLDYTIQIRLDYTIQLRLDQTRLHYIDQTRLDQTTLYSLGQTTLSLILAIYAHILGTHAGLSSHFTPSQPHFSNLCSHFRQRHQE